MDLACQVVSHGAVAMIRWFREPDRPSVERARACGREALARLNGGRIIVLNIISVSRGLPRGDGRKALKEWIQELDRIASDGYFVIDTSGPLALLNRTAIEGLMLLVGIDRSRQHFESSMHSALRKIAMKAGTEIELLLAAAADLKPRSSNLD